VGGALAEKQLRTFIEAEMPHQKKLTDENPENAGWCKKQIPHLQQEKAV